MVKFLQDTNFGKPVLKMRGGKNESRISLDDGMAGGDEDQKKGLGDQPDGQVLRKSNRP